MVTNAKKDSKKRGIAWVFLVILVSCLLVLNYIKFFGAPNKNIKEYPVDSSSEKAIQTALEDIVRNFNNSEELSEYTSQKITMKATLNQHSIFISYITDNTVTYEFSYNNLILDIKVNNDKDNIERFNQVYRLLLKAIQKRINNESDDIDDIISNILNRVQICDGVVIEENDKIISYQVNITKRFIEVEDNIENTIEL